jgi:hypothetical protein
MFFYGESIAAAATNSLGGVTYTAKTVGSAGNNITITYVQGAAGTAATSASRILTAGSGANMGQLSVSAKTAGTAGNNINITFSFSGALTVNVNGNTISVGYGATTTLNDVKNALNANSSVTNKIIVGSITNASATGMFSGGFLSGGTNAVAEEPTAVTDGNGNLNATAITVRIAASQSISGGNNYVPTLVGIVNAAGTSVTASGTGDLTTKTGAVALSGGSD